MPFQKKENRHFLIKSLLGLSFSLLFLTTTLWALDYTKRTSEYFTFPKFIEISSISVKNSTGDFRLIKSENNIWKIKSGTRSHTADQRGVENIINLFENIRKTEVISEEESEQQKFFGFGLNKSIEVTIKDREQTFPFLIGGTENFYNTYISIHDGRTFVIDQNLRSTFERGAKEFWEKKIIQLNFEKIDALQIKYKDTEKMFQKKEKTWKDKSGREVSLTKYFESLKNLKMQNYIKDSPKNSTKHTKYKLHSDTADIQVFFYKNKKPIAFIFCSQEEGRNYLIYSKSEIEGEVFIAEKNAQEILKGDFFIENITF